jgi:hypothetical protein
LSAFDFVFAHEAIAGVNALLGGHECAMQNEKHAKEHGRIIDHFVECW